jgi:hypothetical protein
MVISLVKILTESDKETMSAKEIAQYIARITPNTNDVPDYFIDKVLHSGSEFKLQRLKIEDLLKADSDLRAYVESGEERYGGEEDDYEPNYYELNYPIVVYNGEVIDGYSRVATHKMNGDDYIYGYVN